MNFFQRLQLGATALKVLKAAKELLRWIGSSDIIAIVQKMLEIERANPGSGLGKKKLADLIQWFASEFSGNAQAEPFLRDFASVVVDLLNIVAIFRKP